MEDKILDIVAKYVTGRKNCENLTKELCFLFDVVGSTSSVIEISSKIQMQGRRWWQIYRKGWHKHNDHWGRKWWIRYNWNK